MIGPKCLPMLLSIRNMFEWSIKSVRDIFLCVCPLIQCYEESISSPALHGCKANSIISHLNARNCFVSPINGPIWFLSQIKLNLVSVFRMLKCFNVRPILCTLN
ncbi:hypothetical protein FKM82_024110 [Ascaphus truei]